MEGELPDGASLPPEGNFGAASSCKDSQVREAGKVVGTVCWEPVFSPFCTLSLEFVTFSSCTVVILGTPIIIICKWVSDKRMTWTGLNQIDLKKFAHPCLGSLLLQGDALPSFAWEGKLRPRFRNVGLQIRMVTSFKRSKCTLPGCHPLQPQAPSRG